MVKKVLDDAPAQEAGAAEDRHLSDICHLTRDCATGPRSVRPLKPFALSQSGPITAAPAPTPAESSGLTYVLVLLGAALAAAPTMRWFLNTRGANLLRARSTTVVLVSTRTQRSHAGLASAGGFIIAPQVQRSDISSSTFSTAIYSACRMAKDTIVKVGFSAPPVGELAALGDA